MIEIVANIITLILNTVLGLFVYYRNTKSWTNRLFLLLTIFTTVYIVVNYISLYPPQTTPESQLFWIRIVMFVCSFIGPTLFILVDTFPNDKIKLNNNVLLIVLTLCIFSATLSLLPYVFSGIEYPNGTPVPTPGPGIPVFFIDFVGLFIASFILLIVKYRRSNGVERIQRFYFLIGVIATFSIMALTTVVFVVVFKFSGLVFMGPISILLLIASLAYAIVKHRFLDIRIIVVRAVVYFFVTIVLVAGYVITVFVIGGVLFTNLSLTQERYLSIATSIVLAFSLQPLQGLFEKITSRLLFHNRYEPNKLLAKLSRIMASTITLNDLIEQILNVMAQKIQISTIHMVLIKGPNIELLKSVTTEKELEFDESCVVKIITIASQNPEKILIFQEVGESTEKGIMREYNLEITLPLIVKEELIGALFFGVKSSGEIYSSTDIEVLKILAPAVAVAVKNSLSYEEIKRFNITLEEKVKKATEKLENANKQLKELDALKDEFISMASHELRTPMTAIKSYVWMALNKFPNELNPKMKDYLSIAYASTERMLSLVSDLLTVSRIEGRRYGIIPEQFYLYDILKQVYNELRIKAEERQIKLELKDFISQHQVIGDKNKLIEVFNNIIGNALKYTAIGGEVKIELIESSENTSVKVIDNGMGISEEGKKKLFQKFGRLENSYVKMSEIPGTGLGLYITKQIVEMHGGIIIVESELGKGSAFIIQLPYKQKEGGVNINGSTS
ncbi:MAG: ATP-binding protein [Candidatus Roizmanbacteria bacterium]